MQYELRVSGKHFQKLHKHLFPGDGKEAVAIILCGRYERNDLSVLLTHKIELIPYNECNRYIDNVHWKTERAVHLIEAAANKNMAILKIHSHPGGYAKFSKMDDHSDYEFFQSVFGWCDSDSVHGSIVMLPEGKIFGRVFTSDLKTFKFDKISVAGDTINTWNSSTECFADEYSLRTIQAFGEGTYNHLKKMKIGVLGCSGTGSPTIEQLVRLGVGNIVIIDPDTIEKKNLNRIINSKMSDAEVSRSKVETIQAAINGIGLGTKVFPYSVNLYDSSEALHELITCDVIFGCVDSVDGRHLLSQLTNFYLIPFFDIGVRLDADGKGGIENIYASINYIQPGCSTLLSRGIYTSERLFNDGLLRQDPIEFAKREKAGYVHNANVDRPAVISINMQISSMAVIELLNRIHPFKEDPSKEYAKVTMDYCDTCIIKENEESFKQDVSSEKWAGRGDCKPFLRMSELIL